MKMFEMPLLFTIWLRSGSVSENVLGIVYARDPKNIYTHLVIEKNLICKNSD
jgi:hypothetical protein